MAALNLRFSKRAERQLGDILGFIALDNPEAAAGVAEQVENCLELLLAFPEMGRLAFPNLPHRLVTSYPCRIYYHQRGRVLWVVAVLRVEQLLRPERLARPKEPD
jgi:plasmid stabilization system protein ParE